MNAVIIDDDSVIRSLLGKVLTERGYTVKAYSSPRGCPLYSEPTCPCSWKGPCPDLIVSDYDMPAVNGVEFVKHLKHKQCKCKNIALMSGNWTEPELQQAVPTGVNVFSKPIPLKRLWAWLDEIKRQDPAMADQANRRNSARYACEFPVDVYFSSPGLLEMVSAVARNISRGGILMECSKFLAPMTSCQVAFTVPEWMSFKPSADRAVMLGAEVRHSSSNAGACGLQFVESLA